MSEMVERIAKIIAPDAFPVADDPELCWCPQCRSELEASQNLARQTARDAIQAMREPTEAMMQYAEGMCDFILPDACGPNTPDGRVAEFKMGYQIAIDTALGEYPRGCSAPPVESKSEVVG